MKKYSSITAVLFLMLLGCNNSPKALAYGSDGCHFCSMTIVDKQHAAQIMTKKGRSYAFDATECMLNHLKEIDRQTVALFLVNDYENPGDLVDATQATFLISENIPSPMGEFLTAFRDRQMAENMQTKSKGELFTWQELSERFK